MTTTMRTDKGTEFVHEFNDELIKLVEGRLEKLNASDLSPRDKLGVIVGLSAALSGMAVLTARGSGMNDASIATCMAYAIKRGPTLNDAMAEAEAQGAA